MNEEKQKEIYKWLMKKGMLIGSRAWGGECSWSDYDLVFSNERFKKILPNIIDTNIEWNDLNGMSDSGEDHLMYNTNNYKFIFPENKIVNVITYKECYIDHVKEVNSVMLFMSEQEILRGKLKTKDSRVRLFEMLLFEVLKGTKTGNSLKGFSEDDDIPF